METKEEREARLHALEAEQSQGKFLNNTDSFIWTNADPLSSDPVHKHMKKLVALEDRIDRWKQVGPATTEDEWNQAVEDHEWVTEWRRNCSSDINLRIPKAFLIRMNRLWKKYKTK